MGRPDFSAPGTQGSGQVVAVSDRPEIKSLNASNGGTVASGNTEVTEIYAPTGSTYTVRSLELVVTADIDATTGSHRWDIRPMGHIGTLLGKSNYNTSLVFVRNHWETADLKDQPPTGETVAAVQALKATENSPLQIRYDNDTDVAQENDRKIKAIVEEASY